MSIPVKINGMGLINRVIEGTKEQVAEKQGGFRSGRGYIYSWLRSIERK